MTVESVFEKISGYISNELLMRTLITAFVISLGCFLLAGLLRLISGKHGTAVGSMTAALDILVLYLLVMLLPLVVPGITKFLPALPFASIGTGTIELTSVPELSREALSVQLINLILIAFLFGLADALLPKSQNILVWLLLRVVTILIVCGIFWFFRWLGGSLLPDFIQTYAPILLLVFIALLLALTVFKWFFGIILGVSCGPIVGAVYAFIVGNTVGKQLAKAALTCIILLLLLLLAYQQNILIINMADFPLLILILTVSAPIIARYLISRLF